MMLMNANIQMFTPRLMKLLQILVDQDDFVSVSSLAEQLSTSKRTLFREIQGCNSMLAPFSVQLVTKSGHGILLEGDSKAKSVLQTLIAESMKDTEYVDMDQRRKLLVAELLKNKSIAKLIQFAQLFKVSEATISNDLAAIESWFKDYQLDLIRKPGYGILLVGDEENVRKAMTDFVHEHMSDEQMSDFLYRYESSKDVRDYFNQQSDSSILNLLNHDILDKVMEVLKDNPISYVSNMAESSLVGLIIHLTIAIERLQNQEVIVMDEHLLTKLIQDEDFEKAKRLAEYIEDEFDLTFPDDEIAYILIHIKGAKQKDLGLPKGILTSQLQDIALRQLIHQMIVRFEQESGYALSEDNDLVEGLLTHLRPTLTRLSYQLKIRNPLLQQIQEQYPKIYAHSMASTAVLEKELNRDIPEDEIGYLALHFGAAIERYKQKEKIQMNLVMGVVCASGIGISSLLSSRLRTLFPEVKEIIPLSVDEVELRIESIDILVSTIALKQFKDYIYIHPLLLPQDVDRIKQRLAQVRLSKSSKVVKKEKSTAEVLHDLAVLNAHLQTILTSLKVQEINESNNWHRMVQEICKDMYPDVEQANYLYEQIQRREAMGTLWLDDIKLIILHTKVSMSDEPRVRFYVPNKMIQNHLNQQANVVLCMVTPTKYSKEANPLLSLISSSTLQSEELRAAIVSQDKQQMKEITEQILLDWFKNESVQRLSKT